MELFFVHELKFWSRDLRLHELVNGNVNSENTLSIGK